MHDFPKEPITQGPPKTSRQMRDDLIVNLGGMAVIPAGALLGIALFYLLPMLLSH